MNARRWAALAMMIALPVAGCASNGDSGAAGAAGAAGAGGGTAASLAGTSWELAQYAPAGETALTAVPEEVRATADFTEDQISGSGGCNSFTGAYSTDGDTIEIGPLASTQMACVPAVAAVESGYLARLGAATTYAIAGGTLTLSDGSGRAVLEYTESEPAALTGTTWAATGINNGTGGVTSLVAGSTVTAEFADDGTVSGNAGCNSFNGTYEVLGDTMTIGPLATTRMACEPELSEQEANYLAALENATRFTLDRDRLELRDDEGALQVGYSNG
jgi:heat shock protein HslJ